MSQADWYRWLADAVLGLHFGFVAFVVAGFLVIWAGLAFRWAFVRNFYFRLAHLLAMSVVAAEALGGFLCPLTTWEDKLRWMAGDGQRYAGSFIRHWVHRVMFYEASERTFTVIYVAFFAMIALSLWFVPPRWPWQKAPPTAVL
jgi:hypothetical protein